VTVVYAGKDQISAVIIIAIVVPISLLILLFVAGYCFLISRRARKKYDAIQEENGKRKII
jgi:preprotein translocase subunit YajC